jgi:hypothetical protein
VLISALVLAAFWLSGGAAVASAASCSTVKAAGTNRSETATRVSTDGFSCSSARIVIREYAWQFKGVSGAAVVFVGDGVRLDCARNVRRVTCLTEGGSSISWTQRLGARARACGETSADYPDTEGGSGLRVRAIGISCGDARSIARRCIRQRTVRGWRAGIYGEGDLRQPTGFDLYLVSGSKRIDLRGIAGGGPHCLYS